MRDYILASTHYLGAEVVQLLRRTVDSLEALAQALTARSVRFQ